jgi:hypothetical protein
MNITRNATLNIFSTPHTGYLSWAKNEIYKVNLEEKIGLFAFIILLLIVILVRHRIATSYLDGLLRNNKILELEDDEHNERNMMYTLPPHNENDK